MPAALPNPCVLDLNILLAPCAEPLFLGFFRMPNFDMSQKPTVVRCQWFKLLPRKHLGSLRSEWMKVQIPQSPSGSRIRCAAASAPGIPMPVILLPFGFVSRSVLQIGDSVRFRLAEPANPCTVYSFQWSPLQNRAVCNCGGFVACARCIYVIHIISL